MKKKVSLPPIFVDRDKYGFRKLKMNSLKPKVFKPGEVNILNLKPAASWYGKKNNVQIHLRKKADGSIEMYLRERKR